MATGGRHAPPHPGQLGEDLEIRSESTILTGTLTLDGTPIDYRYRGDGRPLLLLPGGAGHAGVLDRLATHLSDHYSVVAMSSRLVSARPSTGHGDEHAETLPEPPTPDMVELFSVLCRFQALFLEHILIPFTTGDVDLPALGAVGPQLVPAAGIDSRGQLPYRAAAALATRLGLPLTEFPGGHLGPILVRSWLRDIAAPLSTMDGPQMLVAVVAVAVGRVLPAVQAFAVTFAMLIGMFATVAVRRGRQTTPTRPDPMTTTIMLAWWLAASPSSPMSRSSTPLPPVSDRTHGFSLLLAVVLTLYVWLALRPPRILTTSRVGSRRGDGKRR